MMSPEICFIGKTVDFAFEGLKGKTSSNRAEQVLPLQTICRGSSDVDAFEKHDPR